ncbi:unnamed protein product [Cylindrotheca closterium]|uniref:Uncharacterized protein n=1 Tax=Cylindrotheca closterium TaxID=2856 RepID=A0AAD2CJM8_9STRA|nr:unnamed protein product [Cylindrotheca closterium]
MRTSAFTRVKAASAVLQQCRGSLLQGTTRRNLSSSSSSSSTYYDSQSGMHVPVHNVQEISIILDRSQEDSNLSTSFVPAHLYKEDPSSDMPAQLANLHSQGVQGVILPPISFPRDVRNLQTLKHIAPSKDFMFFASAKDVSAAAPLLLQQEQQEEENNSSSSVSLILKFDAEDSNINEGSMDLQKIHDAVGGNTNTITTKVNTTIVLSNIGKEDQNPISIANQVAAWIDANQGGDFIWVPSTCSADANVDSDALERLCEELSYLDLVGKTVASRLMIGGGRMDSTINDELVNETMFSGVNKFVVSNEDDISLIAEIAELQGKSILK